MSIEFKQHRNNSYDVYLLDLKRGNATAVTFNVQCGAWHDEPTRLAGRAHLWEHVIHLGSKKYPGQKTFDQITDKLGARYNAYTSLGRTFYHFVVHPDSVASSLDLLGAMVSQPAFDPEFFKSEKRVVMNEALEYQRMNAMALESGMFIHLAPRGHRLAMFDIGTQEQLEAMDLKDLKALYKANYKPPTAQVLIAGNFSNGSALKQDQVLGYINEFFELPKVEDEVPDEPAARSIEFDDLAGIEKNYLEFGSSDAQKMLSIKFLLPNNSIKGKRTELGLFLDLLNIEMKGGLEDYLTSEGWITSIGVDSQITNNIAIVEAFAQLTEQGAKLRNEVVEKIIEAVHFYSHQPLDEKLVEFLKRARIAHIEELIQHPMKAAEFMAQSLEFPDDLNDTFKFREKIESCTSESVQNFARQVFQKDRFWVGYLGDDVRTGVRDPIFDRDYRLSSSPQEWLKAFEGGGANIADHLKVDLPDIQLQFREQALSHDDQVARVLKTDEPKDLLVLEEKHEAPTGAFTLRLDFPAMDVEEAVCWRLLLEAFDEGMRTELSYLSGLSLLESYDFSQSSLVLRMKGDSLAAQMAADFILKQVLAFEPNQKLFDRAKENLKAEILDNQQQFTAKIAMKELSDRFHKLQFTDAEVLGAMKSVNLDKLHKLKTEQALRANITLAASGDFSEQEIQEVYSKLRQLFPVALADKEVAEREQAHLSVKDVDSSWTPLAETKEEDAFGLVRAYQGPDVESPDFAKLILAMSFLGSEVFQLNRTERELGYIHQASLAIHGKQSLIEFYGQTNGADNLALSIRGWEEILAKVSEKSFELDKLQDAKNGLLLARELQPTTHSDSVRRLFYLLEATRDPQSYQKITSQLREIPLENQDDAKQFWEAVRKYFENKKFTEVLASRQRPEES